MKKQTFPASLDQLYPMLNFLKDDDISSSVMSKVLLACEEVLVNIISYAYPDEKGTIEIHCETKSPDLKIVIIDQGIPFNPLNHHAEGGGIKLLLGLIDHVGYSREKSENRLSIRQKIL